MPCHDCQVKSYNFEESPCPNTSVFKGALVGIHRIGMDTVIVTEQVMDSQNPGLRQVHSDPQHLVPPVLQAHPEHWEGADESYVLHDLHEEADFEFARANGLLD